MAQLLESLAERQGTWSETANTLKKGHEKMRWTVFFVSILGALAAAIASQQQDPARQVSAVIGGVLIATSGMLSARFLTAARSAAWARARAASEALKHTAYLYTTQSAPFDDAATRDNLLRADVERIEKEVDDLLPERAATIRGHTPLQPVDAAAYLDHIGSQIKWYEERALEHRAKARRLRAIEFTLAAIATVITGAVGAVSKQWLQTQTGISFDFVALAGVLTTISAAIMTHIEASRFDYIVVSYLAVARRLRNERDAAPDNMASPSPDLSAFVNACEHAMAEENGSWVAKFSGPAAM